MHPRFRNVVAAMLAMTVLMIFSAIAKAHPPAQPKYASALCYAMHHYYGGSDWHCAPLRWDAYADSWIYSVWAKVGRGYYYIVVTPDGGMLDSVKCGPYPSKCGLKG